MAVSHPTSSVASVAGKYLTVALDGESYGLPVRQVREIIRLQTITPVPHMPDYVKGVINLRGRVVPVVDLRVKVGVKAAFTERTCIVVMQVRRASGAIDPMGFIVDGVDEVVNLLPAEIVPTPDFGMSVDTACLLGMAKVKGQVKMLLDIDRVLGDAQVPDSGVAWSKSEPSFSGNNETLFK